MKNEMTTADLHDGQPKEREMREWFAIDEDAGTIRRVPGYICPDNPGYWWVPSMGWSMCEGKHLFATECEAIDAMIAELERLQTETEERIVALRQRRKTAGAIYA